MQYQENTNLEAGFEKASAKTLPITTIEGSIIDGIVLGLNKKSKKTSAERIPQHFA